MFFQAHVIRVGAPIQKGRDPFGRIDGLIFGFGREEGPSERREDHMAISSLARVKLTAYEEGSINEKVYHGLRVCKGLRVGA